MKVFGIAHIMNEKRDFLLKNKADVGDYLIPSFYIKLIFFAFVLVPLVACAFDGNLYNARSCVRCSLARSIYT